MRILAPLLVLALFATLTVRWIADPHRDRERSWIEGSWELATLRQDVNERFVAHLEGHLERYGDDARTRWFAARAWLRIGDTDRAIDAIWGTAALADAPGTAHRFGVLMLRVLGFGDDETLARPRLGAAAAALALTAGGDQQAAGWLDEGVRTRYDGMYLDLLFSARQYGTAPSRQTVADALRSRGQPVADVIAALMALDSGAYPERDADLARLEEIALRDADRRRQTLVWAAACLALGRSEDDRALDVLAGLHRRLVESPDEVEQDLAGVVAAGLLAGGRWSVLESLAPHLGGRALQSGVRPWYAEAARLRLVRGDPEASAAWLDVWQSLHTSPDPRLAELTAAALLLGDEPPPAEFPVGLVLRSLETGQASPGMRAVAAAWRYRTGDPLGRSRLLQILQERRVDGWTGRDLDVTHWLRLSPVLTVARALQLYDPTSTP